MSLAGTVTLDCEGIGYLVFPTCVSLTLGEDEIFMVSSLDLRFVMACARGMTSFYGTRRPLRAMAPRWSALKLRIKVIMVTTEPTTQLRPCIADHCYLGRRFLARLIRAAASGHNFVAIHL